MPSFERRTRPNRATAATVDAGIALMGSLGRYAAARYLLALGVRFPVIVRALAEPRRRRRANAEARHCAADEHRP